MFRIAFDPKVGSFKVQFNSLYGLYWQDVKMPLTSPGGHEVRRFDTYVEARQWVTEVGLHEGFDEQPTKGHPFRNGHIYQ